ncbi:MAG: hypothetical protein HWE26_04705 [Alteromonadaceae bacterium]|nr:hypothetical protein [Alteromonadaceae bacterium]
MNTFQLVKEIIKQPQVLKPYQPILLLSHMRANTSLAGHILGNHPDINGYYEMHIGYHSWKSFFRQRLIFAEQHRLSSKATYMFDKVLHNEHYISTSLLNNNKTKTLISLRAPETTIPSIVRLYSKVNPTHEFNSVEGATKYYLSRIQKLKNFANLLDDFYYFDAEDLRNNTMQCLSGITEYLELESLLTPEFKSQTLTSAKRVGDSSGNLDAGKIKSFTADYNNFDWSHADIELLREKYNVSRELLQSRSR